MISPQLYRKTPHPWDLLFNWLAARGPALGVAAIALLLYATTAAPGLTWAHDGADGGDLIAACTSGGVPHPSGYPVYCLLARPFAHLPLGPLAHRFNLFSAVAAALTVGILADLIRSVLLEAGLGARGSGAIAMLSGLIGALGPTLWSQAVITEVYALHALFLTLLGRCAWAAHHQGSLKVWLSFGVVAGLGLGNHLTLALTFPGVFLWLWPLRQRRSALAALGGLALGLCAYLYVPLAAGAAPSVSWGDARDLAGFWWLVSGQLYRHYVLAVPLALWPGRLAAIARGALRQLTLPCLALALWSAQGAGAGHVRRLLWCSGSAALLPALYALGYNTSDSHVYLLPVWLVSILWLALGAARVWMALPAGRLRALVPALLALVAIWLGYAGWPEMDLRDDRVAEEWLQAVRSRAPLGAVIITGADTHTFALDYLQWGLGERRDLVALDGELLAYPWYLRQVQSRYGRPIPDTDLQRLIAEYHAMAVPVLLADPRPELEAVYRLVPEGAFWRVYPAPQ